MHDDRPAPPPPSAELTGDPIFAPLNAEQAAAVAHQRGPLAVVAGAGSGKTRVITHRIAWLIRAGVAPSAILGVTFTNKAAKEMRGRVRGLTGHHEVRLATFHSFCAAFLREEFPTVGRSSEFTIYDDADAMALMKRVLAELKIDGETHKPRDQLSRLSRLKNALVDPDLAAARATSHEEEITARVYALYDERLREADACGFDDLLLQSLQLLGEPEIAARWGQRIQYVLVDEFQDTNVVQYRLVLALAQAHGNLCVTGDQDQGIYSWRGADPGNFDRFLDDHPSAPIVRLERNYRSSASILGAATRVIACNVHRIPKTLWTDQPPGETVKVVGFDDDIQEAQAIAKEAQRLIDEERVPPSEIAIFYRANSLSGPIERCMLQAGLPFTVVGGLEFFARAEVKDVLAYLRFLANPRDVVSLLRIINTPPRGIGTKTREEILNLARGEGRAIGAVLRDPSLRGGLSARARTALDQFAAILGQLDARRKDPVPEIIRAVLERTGYGTWLEGKGSKAGSLDPLGNVNQLLAMANDMDKETGLDLAGFLAQVSLYTDLDRSQDARERVSLMTLHTSKGLEFDAVFLVGAEEGLLPHIMSTESPGGLEEERRLFHVGLTRARKRLVVTHSAARNRFGRLQHGVPSRFLSEIGEEGIERFDRPNDAHETSGRGEHLEEYEDESHPLAYLKKGSPVDHPDYGRGRVEGFRGRARGLDRKVSIAFEDGAVRILVLRHSGLELAEDEG